MLIKVKAFPGSKKRGISQKGDKIEVKVKEKARENDANRAVAKSLASFFGVSEKKIRLIKGARGQNKIFKIYD